LNCPSKHTYGTLSTVCSSFAEVQSKISLGNIRINVLLHRAGVTEVCHSPYKAECSIFPYCEGR